MHMGNYKESLDLCYQASKLKPNKYWKAIAAIHEHFKNYEVAFESIEKALINNPKSLVVTQMRSALRYGLEYGENFHLPIANSLLLFKLPYEDTIIYTTKVKIELLNAAVTLDAIMTNVGIKTYIYKTGFKYIPWESIHLSKNGKFSVFNFRYSLAFDSRFETKSKFNIRRKNFNNYITNTIKKINN